MNLDENPPHGYIPPGPLDAPPWEGGYCLPETRREAFAAVLQGVRTGTYDNRVLAWLAGLDDPTCRTVASLLWRARLAGGIHLTARLDGLRRMLGAVLADEHRDRRLVLEAAERELTAITEARPGPPDTSADIAALLAEGYTVAFTRLPGGPDCLVVLTGPLGSTARGFGYTPAEALRSAWPLGDDELSGGAR
jgi:hypothetical protein